MPMSARGRRVGTIVVGRLRDEPFSDDDVAILAAAAGQIAFAVANALAFQEIAALRDKLALEKVYLEDELRSQYDFEEIVGESPALKAVLAQVETVGPDFVDRADSRRDRNGQGAHRPGDPPAVAPQGADARQDELRRDSHGPSGERALRPRARRVHRRDRAEDRPVRARRRRNALSRRGRRHSARAPAEAAARPAGAGVRAPRQHADEACGRADRGSDASEPRRDGRRGDVPAATSTTA